MNTNQDIPLTQIAELMAHNGYDFTEMAPGVLRVHDLHSGVSFQAALEANVLYLTVHLMTIPTRDVTADLMRKMLSGHNGISTSGFRLYDSADGKILITLNTFCTLQDMGPEDHDDILKLAGYLMADVVAARDLLQPAAAA